MKLRKIAGWSLLSTIPLGMFVVAVLDNSVPEFLAAIGIAVLLFAVVGTAFWLIDGDR